MIADQITGETRDLMVDDDLYRASSHAEVGCRGCHERGYRRVPHTHSGYYPRFLCVDCHAKDDVGEQFRLVERKRALLESVHGEALDPPLDCHTCHDPHEFRPVRDTESPLRRSAQSNAKCTSCHGHEGDRLEGFENLPDTYLTHGHFPNVALHFRKVKCVTCHAERGSTTSHDILPARKAVDECTRCHARDSALLQANFRRPGKGTDSVRENAYVIGSTRSRWLDRLSQLGFLVVVALVGTHAIARMRQARKRSRR